MSISYLQRSRNLWYYARVRIPADVALFFPGHEFKRSLKTKDFAEARSRLRVWLHGLEAVFAEIRRGLLTKAEIDILVKQFFSEIVNANNLKHPAVNDGKIVTMSAKASAAISVRLINRDKVDLKENNLKNISNRVERFLAAIDNRVEQDSPLHAHLCRQFLVARIRAMEILLARSEGDYNNPLDRLDDVIFGGTVTGTGEATHQSTSSSMPRGKQLDEIISLYYREHETNKSWSEKTRAEVEASLTLFSEIIGVQAIEEYGYEDFLSYREKLCLFPKNRNKNPKYRSKSLAEVLRMKIPEDDRLDITTVNKNLTRISSLFKWAKDRRFIPTNPAENLCLPKSKLGHEQRDCYDLVDLQKLVDALRYHHRKPEQFWVPLIGLLQGMRLDEICQLYMADIIEIDGCPVININGKVPGEKPRKQVDYFPGQKLKNSSSKRKIAVHPKLIELGFLRYVEEMRAKGVERLWPRLKRGKNGFSGATGNWYQRFNRSFVTDNLNKVFHSLRHNFANEAEKQKGVEHRVVQAMLGHVPADITTTHYIKPEVKEMLAVLRKVRYEGLDLSSLKDQLAGDFKKSPRQRLAQPKASDDVSARRKVASGKQADIAA